MRRRLIALITCFALALSVPAASAQYGPGYPINPGVTKKKCKKKKKVLKRGKCVKKKKNRSGSR